ncbi:calpain-5 [Plakobranchus ocellatus]|uniref:Calpain-5 n=1 Tax=Plakobranchus ocellatus TaxID=259542 RepID=A0AAV4AMQ7_9GAST|nr:calpain-5 [Plakobranchus ocellatus]
MPVDFRGQSYAKIKKDCLSKGILFEDPEFPASSKSLYFSKVVNDVTWMRPRVRSIVELGFSPIFSNSNIADFD